MRRDVAARVAGVGVIAASGLSSATLGGVVVDRRAADLVGVESTGDWVVVEGERTEGLTAVVTEPAVAGKGTGTGTDATEGCDSTCEPVRVSSEGISLASLPASISAGRCGWGMAEFESAGAPRGC